MVHERRLNIGVVLIARLFIFFDVFLAGYANIRSVNYKRKTFHKSIGNGKFTKLYAKLQIPDNENRFVREKSLITKNYFVIYVTINKGHDK